jgi:hypothetical protein
MLAYLLALTLMAQPTPQTVRVQLGPKHLTILQATDRFFDVEGALRSAKTWTVLIKLRQRLEEEPGIQGFMARWTEEGLNQKLIPDWRRVCALLHVSHGTWNAQESCFDFENGSRLYAIHGKSSQKDNRYGKVRGLTVAFGYIDQLEEWPEDVFDEAALRLSQPGYWQQMIVSPNPVPTGHWIANKFPIDNRHADHRYLSLAIWDNAHNLDAATIAAAERLYPVGHPQRRVKLEGLRGLDVSGKPVYVGAFNRDRHVRSLALSPQLPLCESYDYGFHHPCVLWYQYAPWGWLRVLGGVMGNDLHLDAFLPIVERYRKAWFAEATILEATCDPAGANENAQGLRGTPVGLLRDWYREHGQRDTKGQTVSPRFLKDANVPERRHAANQLAATYMRRQVNGDEAFLVDGERWALVDAAEGAFDNFFIDGLEAGYVLEEEARHSTKLGSYWVPKKDGFYEHPQNCFEYGLQAHVHDLPLGGERAAKAILKHDQRLIKQAQLRLAAEQKDTDPDEPRRARWSSSGTRGRGGYG